MLAVESSKPKEATVPNLGFVTKELELLFPEATSMYLAP